MIFWLINDFVRSGYVYIRYGKLEGSGDYGDYWYAVPYDRDLAYYFDFGDEDVYIDDDDYVMHRYYGYSLRCLSAVLDR